MLVLYGDHDQFTGIGRYEAWVKSLQEGGKLTSETTVIADTRIVGADHFWWGEALDRMLIEVEKWINEMA